MIDAAGERSEQGRFLRDSSGSSNAVLGLAVEPSPRVSVAMKDADDADHGREDLEVYAVWIGAE
jgi:hypothetical protein